MEEMVDLLIDESSDIEFRRRTPVLHPRNISCRLMVTVLAAAAIIALGLGLGLGLGLSNMWRGTAPDRMGATTPQPETSTDSAPPGPTASASVEGHYRYAAVSTDSEYCSTVGTELMATEGGSAVDAAVSVLLCGCLINPHSCGLGGGFFMVVYNRQNGTAVTFNAREMAPKAAHEDMYVDVDGSPSKEGGMAIGIPGEIKGLYEAHKLYGKLPWRRLFELPIKLCEEGVTIRRAVAVAIETGKQFIDRYPGLGDVITNPETGTFYEVGDVLKRPKLARVLRALAEEGPDAFYDGSLTADIVSDITDAGGIITAEDLRDYYVNVSDALTVPIDDEISVMSLRPPSSGVILAYILKIVRGWDFSAASISSLEDKIRTYHRIIEAFKFAFGHRTHLGDEKFLDDLAPFIENITTDSYAALTRSKIDDDQTFNYTYYGATYVDDISVGTSHISVMGPNGDAVSATSTINTYWGCKVVGSRTGIIFNNEMDDFSTPNLTNYFGVPPSAANFIRPGKRPLSSMSPTIVVNQTGDVIFVGGASGGTRITTMTAWVIIRALWLGESLKAAIDYPRIHHQLVPPYLYYEPTFPKEILDGLEKKGHELRMRDVIAVVQAILRDDDYIAANADYRKGGTVDGF